jgi:transposase
LTNSENDIPLRDVLDRLIADRDEYVAQIKDLCAEEGICDYEPLSEDRMERLERLRTRDGRVLPPNLKDWIFRTLQRLELVLKMIAEIEAEPAADR